MNNFQNAQAISVFIFVTMIDLVISSAKADTVTLSELNGTTIESRVIRLQTVRRNGKEYSGRIQSDVTITLGPGDNARARQVIYWLSSTSRLPPVEVSKSTKITKVWDGNYGGKGHRVAVFLDGTLTYLKTHRRGAYKMSIKFLRADNGIICKSSETHVKEMGVEGILLDSAWGQGPTWIIRDRQVSSSCRISHP